MVETPRAALRAGEIAQHAAFLSFGTNDLTQMTYGLSRDDAGRFMNTYVRLGVFPEDPFHILDIDGVGELLHIGAERGRKTRKDLTLSICGEHGGNPESIAFCRRQGSITCPVRPIGCRWRVWRRRILRSTTGRKTFKYHGIVTIS
jgi:pyruvate, orthophosphate dikinase